MAIFKVGDRVRKVCSYRTKDAGNWPTDNEGAWGAIGAEGTVVVTGNARGVLLPPGCVGVLFDDGRSSHASGAYACYPYQLAPLTDPGADSFMERIRKLKPYDEPKVERKSPVTNRSEETK